MFAIFTSLLEPFKMNVTKIQIGRKRVKSTSAQLLIFIIRQGKERQRKKDIIHEHLLFDNYSSTEI